MKVTKYFFTLLLVEGIFFFPLHGAAQTYLGNFTSFSIDGKSVSINADTSALRFVFYKPNIVRVDFLPSPTTLLDTSLVVIQDTTQPVNITVSDGDSNLTIRTSSLEIICQKFPLRVSYYDGTGLLLAKEPPQGGISEYYASRTANFSVEPNEHFYGTGERGLSLDLRSEAFDSYNEQSGGYPATGGIPHTMNVNIPFIISTNNYGIYFEDTYKAHFDISYSNPGILSYAASGGELSYYFINDASMLGVLSDYTWLTGRAPLLPKWAYGYIQSKFGYHNPAQAQSMIQQMHADSIPCDAIILDLYWFQNMGDLSWNTSIWPNPEQITSDFLLQGFKTIVITEPFVAQPSSNYSTADQDGYFAKDSSNKTYVLQNWWSCGCDAGLLDITNPDAQSWWWSKYDAIFNTGVTALWTDLGEPERDYTDMHFYMGPDLKVHNIYDFLWAKILFNGFGNAFPNRRLFNLTRSGYAGIQRFGAVTWSGDVSKTFPGLAVQLPFLLNMGMSGITYHNSDIGGFDAGSTTPELYTRWMEFGAFCPVMRAHGYDADNGTEPWTFGAATEDIVRKMIQLRYSLLPYNYTMAHEAYESGIPMARPLILEYPSDPNVVNESSAYMWGDDFLVAPIVQAGETSQTFYLPAGKWINFWNDQVIKGGNNVTLSAPIDQVPLLVKAGSIIPMQPVMRYVDQNPADTIYLTIYPDASTAFLLYEDNGNTLDYQTGSFATTPIVESMAGDGNSGNMQVTIGASTDSYSGKPDQRTYLCLIHKVSTEPKDVLLQGVALTNVASQDSLNKSGNGFFFDATAQILHIKMSADCDSSYSIQIDSIDVTEIKSKSSTPSGFDLDQNFPNPFNPSTVISYRISTSCNVTLKVYDVLGREITTLINEGQSPGEHHAVFKGDGLPSGVYLYRLNAGTFQSTKEMVLVK